MIKNTKKIMLFMALFTTGLYLQSSQEVSPQDTIASKMIAAMQGCINFNKQAQQPLSTSGIFEQRSVWNKSVAQYHEYIGDLRAQNSHIEKAALVNLPASEKNADDLMMQVNESKFLFARLLDEYIAYLGQVYEKQSGLFGGYRTSYYISSKDNQSLSIMPNEYNLFVQTLQKAAQQSDWGKTINLTLPVITERRLISEKNFTLNEILAAVRNVPLPIGYSTAAIIGGVAAATAIVGGAYYAYNNMNQLKDSMNQIEGYLSSSAKQVEPMIEPVAVKPVVEAEPSFFENMQSGFRRGVYGDEAVVLPGALAGGDAENYGLSGYSGQEALGTVALGAHIGAEMTRFAATKAPITSKPGIETFKANLANPATKKEIAKDIAVSSLGFGAFQAGIEGGIEAYKGGSNDDIMHASIEGAKHGAITGAFFGAGGTAAKVAGYGGGGQFIGGVGASIVPGMLP